MHDHGKRMPMSEKEDNMINEANEYTVLSAGSDLSGGELVTLTDADLASVLGGGEESRVSGGDQPYPSGPGPMNAAEQFVQYWIMSLASDATQLLRIPIIQSVLFPPRPTA